ncbi:hypothetical protein ACFWSF_11005 [Streptomyces sp. NPDC058611]
MTAPVAIGHDSRAQAHTLVSAEGEERGGGRLDRRKETASPLP